jgi:hypothetical protein
MIFVARAADGQQRIDASVRVVRTRATPPLVTATPGERDLFCVGDEEAAERVRAQGWKVVPLHDGWYADDEGGGVAVWGNGRYWEVRATPFDVIARE